MSVPGALDPLAAKTFDLICGHGAKPVVEGVASF